MMQRLKSDRALSKQILSTIKASTKTTISPMNSRRQTPQNKSSRFGRSINNEDSMFFMTEGGGSGGSR